MREVKDHYFRLAKQEGYLSRAAYKLIEIDDRKKVLRRGDLVLDCGAAPGSWLQVAAGRLGPRGLVVGIDLQPISLRLPNVRTLVGDFTAIDAAQLLGAAQGRRDASDFTKFDVILSDMAPSTTGDPSGDHFRSVRLCESVLGRCRELLKPGGNLVMKVFEGQAYPGLLKDAARAFQIAKGFKPKASRSESTEIYLVGTGFRALPGTESEGATGSDALPAAPPRRKQSPGWNT